VELEDQLAALRMSPTGTTLAAAHEVLAPLVECAVAKYLHVYAC